MVKIEDPRLAAFAEDVECHIGKLRRYATGVTDEEMSWRPTGISNPLAWLIRHCADLLWLSYGRISGEPVPVNLAQSRIAGSAFGDVQYEPGAPPPRESAGDAIAYLNEAWATLKGHLIENAPSLGELELIIDRRRRDVWTFLEHFLADLCYHTGQASYLRKLLAAERRRKR